MRHAIGLAFIALNAFGCSAAPRHAASHGDRTTPPDAASSSSAELDAKIAEQAVFFEPGTLPSSLVDRLADERVVMLGEHHGYREHHDFLVAIVKALHGRGGRWVLFEGFQAESWSVDAYVNGAVDDLSPPTEKYFGYTLRQLRSYNLGLARDQRLHVAFVDINHRPWAFPLALARMLDHVERRPCLEAFLTDVGWDRALPIDQAQAAFEQSWSADRDGYHARLRSLGAELSDEQRRDAGCFASSDDPGGDRAAFLPVDDPWFRHRAMPVSYMHQVVEHPPGAVFDGYVLLPRGSKLY